MDANNARMTVAIVTSAAAVVFAASLLFKGVPSTASRSSPPLLPSVDRRVRLWSRLERRSLRSLSYLLAAFGPKGYNAPGTAAGTMIASPSRPGDRPGGKDENENYFFQWPRDGSLCLREVIRALMEAQDGHMVGANLERAATMDRIIRDFVTMNVKLQHTPNRSGTFETGGLGEPKFNVDGSPFEDDWGRPQNDGPALRSIALIAYATYMLDSKAKGIHEFIESTLWNKRGSGASLIKDDLDYVARCWKQSTYELWEEVDANSELGGHFHVLMVQRRALLAGALFARHPAINDGSTADRYESVVEEIEKRLDLFWNPQGVLDKEGGPQYSDGPLSIDWNDARQLGKIPRSILGAPHVLGTLNRLNGQPKPCQVDTAVLLGFTHGWNGNLTARDEDDAWLPWSEKCLVTLERLVKTFAVVYPINAGRSIAHGVMVGRYPEDVYDGVGQSIGHAWFLCTHAIAEILYVTAQHYVAQQEQPIVVSELTANFWSVVSHAASEAYHEADATDHLRSKIMPGTYHRGDHTYERLLTGLWRMGDNYLSVCDEFVAPGDLMSEQVERKTGKMRGARELTWSYASFRSAHAAKRGVFLPLS